MINYSTILWPKKGLDIDESFHSQREETTPDCQNVMSYDQISSRRRGGQRGGLVKYNASQVSSSNKLQDIGHVVTSNTSSLSPTAVVHRNVYAYAVANGTVARFTGSSMTTASGGSSALDANAPAIFSASLFGVVYFADGTNKKTWTPGTNTVGTWTESAGTLPINGSDRPRLIELYRQRIIQSGLKGDGHNWFASALGDATDWDYSPATTVETQAVAGNNADAGKVGDLVNCMAPHNDDLLIFGCDSSIWQMTGDPMAGGRIDSVSQTTGMAFGRPYCKTPDGVIYFIGSRGGLWRMAPTVLPFRVSGGRVDSRLSDYDFDSTIVRMAYDDARQGVWAFFTPLDGSATTHYFYDLRTEAFLPQVFANANHNPTAVTVYDGDTAADRVMLLGGYDGYIRYVSDSAKDDDDTAISSHIYLGPIKSRGQARTMLREIRAVLDADCEVNYEVYAGDSAQAAFEATTPRLDGVFYGGRSKADRRRCQGHVFYIKLKNSRLGESWAMETLQIGRKPIGKSRDRIPE